MSATVLVGFLLSFTAIAYAGVPLWVQHISNLAGFILAAFFFLPFIRGRAALPKSPIDKWIMLYCMWFALSFICSGYKYASRAEFFNLLTGLTVFYTTVGIRNSDSGQKRLNYVLILYGIFVISAMVAGIKVSYLMLNPNIAAGYLAALLPALSGVMFGESCYVRFFGFIIAGAGLVCLLFTGSIWGLISLLVALLLVLCVKKHNLKLLMILFIPVFMFAWHLVPVSSVVDRLNWWQAGLKALWKHIVLGLGPGVFSEAYRGFAADVSQHSLYAHNYFIQLGAEIGLPGLLLWLFVIISWFRWFLSQKLTYTKIGALVGILALCIHNLADYSLNIPAHWLLFWFLLGYSCPSFYIKEPKRLPVVLRIILLTILFSFGMHLSQVFAAWHKVNVAKIETAQGSLTKAKMLARQAAKLDRISPEPYAILARIEIESYQQDGLASHFYRAANFLEDALARSPYSLELKQDLHKVKSLVYSLKSNV